MKWFEKKKNITTLPPLEGYNRWATSYHLEANPVKQLSDDMVNRYMPLLKDKSFLDAGCGAGKFCSHAAEDGASNILGLDLSPVMIESARKHCPSASLVCGDISTVRLERENFDVITCALVLGHLEQLDPALNNLFTSLRTGGKIIITDFHPFLTLNHSKRTFRHGETGKTFEVEHYLHLFEDYFRNFKKNHVTVEILEEPRFEGVPVVFGILAEKRA